MESLATTFKRIGDRLSNPLPDWALCDDCGKLRLHVPSVRELAVGRVGHADVPACECETGQQAAIDARLALSGVPHQAADDYPRLFQNFTPREGTDDAYGSAHAFTRHADPVILTLVGPVGSGKSHLAEAICREYLGRNVQARYEYVPRLLDAMRGVDGTEVNEVMSRCALCRVLVLDDIGMGNATEFTSEKVTAIVEERLSRHAKVVITTNKTREQLAGMGYERLASRMFAVGTGEAAVAALHPRTDARESGVQS